MVPFPSRDREEADKRECGTTFLGNGSLCVGRSPTYLSNTTLPATIV